MTGKVRGGFAILAIAVIAAVTTIVLPAAAETKPGNRLDAHIVATNDGPLLPCSSGCSSANTVRYFIYVTNKNRPTNEPAPTRAAVPNAFVVNGISLRIFIDGAQWHDYDFTYTPPPYPSYAPYSGHWPSTVTCPQEGPPCNVVTSPAVLPGEKTAIFYTGWSHGDTEPNGTYVFDYTIHGTLNGTPIDLSVSSPPISMLG